MLGLGVQELKLILVIAMFFFCGKKQPEIAKGMGKGIREFKLASEGGADDEDEHIESKGHEEPKKKLESKT
jgi:sec-independent protein translocase protein TatA